MCREELIDAIDHNNNVIGKMTKDELYKNQVSHRVVHIMVVHDNKLYLPRRSPKVHYLPGHYCSSAAGHVQSGETSLEGALRELKEEIGLEGPVELVKEFFFTHEFKVHVSLYIRKFNPDHDIIKINPEEVLSGEFYSFEEISKLDQNMFHPQLPVCIKEMENYND